MNSFFLSYKACSYSLCFILSFFVSCSFLSFSQGLPFNRSTSHKLLLSLSFSYWPFSFSCHHYPFPQMWSPAFFLLRYKSSRLVQRWTWRKNVFEKNKALKKLAEVFVREPLSRLVFLKPKKVIPFKARKFFICVFHVKYEFFCAKLLFFFSSAVS